MQILKSSNHQIIKSSNHQIIKSSKNSVRTFARLSIGIFKFIFSSMAMLAVTTGVVNATSPILQPSTSVPADNATGVAANANIVLTFDVNLYNAGPFVIVELYDSSNTLIESFTASGATTMSGSNGGSASITSNQITLVLGAPLTNGTYHIVIPTTTELYDATGTNRAVAVTNATTYNFTVGSVSSPPVSAPIDLHFSKQVETFVTEIEVK